MDEYRGRYEAHYRREQQQQQDHHAQPDHHEDGHHYQEPPPPVLESGPPPSRGFLGNFGFGDGFDDYLPIILILLGAVGVYLWLGKQEGGPLGGLGGLGSLGGLLGGFLK